MIARNMKVYHVKNDIKFRNGKLTRIKSTGLDLETDVDITPIYNEWIVDTNVNFGLLVCNGRCFSSSTVNQVLDKFTDFLPTIFIDLENTLRRSKRYGGRQCSNFPKKCCYKEHTVTFKEIGLDFIIQPTSFNAGLCVGQCDFMWFEQFYHSTIMSRALLSSDDTPYLCCSPARLVSR